MQNPLIKNNKTWLYCDIQHRTSHYNRIICARSMYNTDFSASSKHQQSILDHINCKYRNKVEADRKRANDKLVKSLIQIENRDNSFRKGEEKYREPLSLKSQFGVKSESNKIMEENLQLFKRIVHASSEIGSKRKWKSRKKKLENYSKLLDNKRQSFINLDQQFYSVYQKLRHKKKPESVIKVESNLCESQKIRSLRSKRKQKFYTQPVELNQQDEFDQ